MPGENAHWEILQEVSRSEKLSSDARGCIQKYSECAALGAMGHDALYYYMAGTSKLANEAGAFIHGAYGDDPLSFLQTALNFANQKKSSAATRAFIYGMATHYATDVSFHPLVYYFTGDYYAEDPVERNLSRVRHRRFESWLDAWWKERLNGPPYKAGRLFRRAKPKLAQICEVLEMSISEVGANYPIDRSFWYWALKHLAFICDLTNNYFAGAVVKAAATISGGKFDSPEAISKFKRNGALPIFDETFEFKMPVSGTAKQMKVMDLRDASIQRSIEAINSLGPDQTNIQGLSMDMGEAGVKTSDAKYFASNMVLLK